LTRNVLVASFLNIASVLNPLSKEPPGGSFGWNER